MIKHCLDEGDEADDTGSWSEWSPWSSCHVTCGPGKRMRKRKCLGGNEPSTGCKGQSLQISNCNNTPCGTHVANLFMFIYQDSIKCTVNLKIIMFMYRDLSIFPPDSSFIQVRLKP